jgi:broad specificity phosphatase PhoE
MKKNVYFIRHGESEGNKNETVQNKETPLSEKGIRQAALAKERVGKLNIDTYITSTMRRAEHTGEIIFFDKLNGDISKIIRSELFQEYMMPSSIHGLPVDSDEYRQVLKSWEENLQDEDYKFGDEESDLEFRDRLVQALSFLESLEGEDIAVVTHGYFLKNLLAYILLNGQGSAAEINAVAQRMITANTGITKLLFNSAKQNKWKISVFNDHSHLMDLVTENSGA